MPGSRAACNGYEHFVNDSSDGLGEIDDAHVWRVLVEQTLIVYVEPDVLERVAAAL